MSSDIHPALRALGVAVESPVGIRRVRAVIRDLAVRGTLTDHLGADEAAPDLLAAINRDHSAVAAPVADAPYGLPKGWAWANFEQVASIESNLVNPAEFRTRPHIAPDNIEKGTGRLLAYRTIGEDGMTSGKHRFFAGQILYSKIRPNLSKVVIVDFDGLCSADMYPIRAKVDTRFLHLFMLSSAFLEQVVRDDNRLAMPKVNQEQLRNTVVPVPPLAEQKRIVAKVDQLMALCDDLEAKQTKKRDLATQSTRSALTALTTAETDGELARAWHRVAGGFDFIASTAEHLRILRSTVVELALRGRLTAQRADDEPTEDLLARIEEQRAALFERRRIGRGAGQQHHLEKEAPFAIPPSWRWTSLESLAGHIVDGTHHTPTYVSAGVPFISAKDIRGGRLRFDACRYIPRSEYDDLKKRCLPRLGNVLVSKSGSIGEVALVNTDREFTLFESVALVPVLPSVVASYVLLAVSHSAAGKFGQERQKGVGVRHLHLVDLRQLPVPLPPFAEQKRIVAKVAEFMSLLDDLEAKLRKQEETATRLAESLAAAVAA